MVVEPVLHFIGDQASASAGGNDFQKRSPVNGSLKVGVHSLALFTEIKNVCIKL